MIGSQSYRAARCTLIIMPLWVFTALAIINGQSSRTANTPQRPAPISSSSATKQFQLPTPVAETPVPIVDASGEGVQILSFITPGANFERNVVKNAPFWADSLTEHIQTLADGNRVSRKSTSHIYRDGAGRTRREHELTGGGAPAPNGELPRLVVLNDPIGLVNYIIETHEGFARKKVLLPGEVMESTERALGIYAPFRVMMPRSAAHRRPAEGEAAPQPLRTQKERLEPQLIDGVAAEGTRIVLTIPADRFQNEQPVVITHEEWFAPELHIIVLMKHNDPRFGETTFRLTNITRGEPSPALFQLPNGYRVIYEPKPRDDGRVNREPK
jgi:hypothetical protein